MKKFHLSTYIYFTITFVVIVSTLVISGTLYLSLTKSLTSEFEERVSAQCGETLQILSNRFQETKNRLRELSLDNTIRVTLMLGVDQQLKEHLTQKYRSGNGTYFFIKPIKSEKIFKSSDSDLSQKELGAILSSSSSAGKLVRLGKYGFIYSLSYPVFRQKDRIGTAGAIYILKNDKNFLKFIRKNKTNYIIKVDNGRAWDILTGKVINGFNPLTVKINRHGLSYIVLNHEKTAVVVSKEFPDLIYMSSLVKLHNEKIKVLRPVLYSLVFVLILTIIISFFLSRLLARPLSELSQLSLKIAEGKPYTDGQRISSNVMEVGQLMSSLSIMVNNLKRTEELKRYQQLFEGVADPVFIYDFSGRFLEVNQIALDQFGFSKQEFENTTLMNIIPQKQCNNISALIEDIARTGGPVVFETEMFTKNSTSVYVECRSRKIIFKGKKAVLSVARDITDRKIAERERKRLEAELRQSHKMEAMGTLAGGIAHDFNNILSGIFGYCQLAEMNVLNPVKAKAYISQVFKGAQRAAGLTQQILSFARQTEHEKHLLNISVVVKEALKLLRASIPTTIEIKSNICSDTPVMADPVQIHQVIMNLCTNAYHAMRKKGGILEVELNDIEISGKNSIPDVNILPGKYVELKVSDTGHGMDEEILEKIFDPYFSTKKKGEGTGLGLALVYSIVEEHNGYIKVYSTVGKGTQFYVFFPVANEKITSRGSSGDTKPLKGGKERIMVVDDEKSIIDSIEEFLKDYGFKVTTFSNGADAFEEFEKFPNDFDLVITDMTMPRMTGDRLSANILKIRKDIPIILCSGYSENISEEKAVEIGIKKYVQKPIDSQRLMSLIRELLDE